MVGNRSKWCQDFFRQLLACVVASWRVLGGPWGAFGAPWVLLGGAVGLPGLPEGGHSGGLMRIPGLLLVALGGLLSILGRSWGTFQAIPGDSGSHFGFILASLFDDFSYFF